MFTGIFNNTKLTSWTQMTYSYVALKYFAILIVYYKPWKQSKVQYIFFYTRLLLPETEHLDFVTKQTLNF